MSLDAVSATRFGIVTDEYYMKLALKEAKKAYLIDEVPVGAVIVKDDKIIARGYNIREKSQDSIKHAEIIAIEKACKKIGSWRLEGAKLYVTLEPCPMCAGAIIQSRIEEVYFGAYDKKFGAAGSVLNLFEYKFNHQVLFKGGLLEDKSKELLQSFFKKLRESN